MPVVRARIQWMAFDGYMKGWILCLYDFYS